MSGFMQKMNLNKYCILLSDLNIEVLEKRFSMLENEYEDYRQYLCKKHEEMRLASFRTTELLQASINKYMYEGRDRYD